MHLQSLKATLDSTPHILALLTSLSYQTIIPLPKTTALTSPWLLPLFSITLLSILYLLRYPDPRLFFFIHTNRRRQIIEVIRTTSCVSILGLEMSVVAMRILQTCYDKLGPIGNEDGSIDVGPVIIGTFLLVIFTAGWLVVALTLPVAVGAWKTMLAYEEVKAGGGEQRSDEEFSLQTVDETSESK